MDVRVKILDGSIPLPSYANPGDAAMDLRSVEDVEMAPGERAIVGCGFAIEIPEGFCGLVLPRSGLAAKHGITVLNSPGLIDSGYRGEIRVVLLNTDTSHKFQISKGDRIAQIMLLRVDHVNCVTVDELDGTDRGESGFGSSGIA